ncbi:MAG: hypothetical protein KIS94_14090 [Chitinophagales bacterium]|nr:hypothetical protein [Chitinophagales bacterium]
MLKKAVALFFLVTFSSVVFYACRCKEQNHFLRFENLYTHIFSSAQNGWNDSVFAGDTLYVDLAAQLSCVAQSKVAPAFLITSVNATSIHCPCGELGFRSKLTGISVVANTVYGGFLPGTDITNLFAAYTWMRNTDNSVVYSYYHSSSFTELLKQNTNAENGMGGSSLSLFVTQKPADSFLHSFTFRFHTADSVYSVATQNFRWQ